MDKEYTQYLLEKTKRDYNLIAEEFSQTRHNLWPELFAIFNDYTRDGDKVLDIGCGNGRLLDLVSGKKIDYIGIDNSEGQIKEAQKKYPGKNFIVADAFNLPFADNSFDNIFLIAILHHIPSIKLRQRVVSEAKRVLKINGILMLTVWDLWRSGFIGPILKYFFLKLAGRSKMDFGDVLMPWGKKTKRYYHFFTKKEIEKLVGDSGLKMLKSGIVRNETGKRSNLYLIAKKFPAPN